ncbi:MAG: GNAT family N-acetyltransferase [Pirellulaceae bacterium]|nr:GNAT family N-acetyltransferase [Pirellulaceae bacterium]
MPLDIAILHNAVAPEDSAAVRDVLVQVEAVEAACRELGHRTRRLACTLNLEAIEHSLTHERPALAFNLVESLGGSDRLAHLAAVLLDDLDLPYTGTAATAQHLTNNKPLAKQRLRAEGLPTADWATIRDVPATTLPPPYIIKAVWEHASVGLDDHSIIATGEGDTVVEQIASRSRQLGRECFAERFIEGREFNLSLVAGSDEPHVLPPAEIDFSAFPTGKPRIVGYAAKWTQGTLEFEQTPRKFDFPPADAPLLDWLRTLAVQCWRLFDLRGYARVDFRVDAKGRPFILEVNANPCLSPDAGFAAALNRANVPLTRAVEWIIDDARRPRVDPLLSSARGASSPTPAPSEPDEPPSDADSTVGKPAIKLRGEVRPTDAKAVRRIVDAAGLFRPAEVDVAVELVEARLEKGAASGYEFVFVQQGRSTVGYACFGRNTLTVSSWDLYWIAVDPKLHGQGIGRLLLAEAERRAMAAEGTRLYIETSHRADYQPTRGFYERCGYKLEAILADFYAPGDSKAIYVKCFAS